MIRQTWVRLVFLNLLATITTGASLFFWLSESVLAFQFVTPEPSPQPCLSGPGTVYCSTEILTLPDGILTTQLLPVTELSLGGTQFFLSMLNNSVWRANGWQFQPSGTNLSGYFGIATYNAFARPTAIGAEMQLIYFPSGNDPSNNIRWIQVISTNHQIITSRYSGVISQQYGTLSYKIDVLHEQANPNFVDTSNPQTFNPFYNTYAQSTTANFTNDFFFDAPTRERVRDPHTWRAELYLVELTAPQTVTIHNGISWGWTSSFTPTSAQGCTGGSGGGGCEQSDPVEGIVIDGDYGSLLFGNVSSGSWYGAGALLPPNLLVPDRYGIQFQALEGSLFNSIDALPLGIDADDLFTIAVDGTVLGEFAAADSIDFVSLLGSGVASFEISGIEPILGTAADPLLPIQLSFAGDTGSFSTSLLDCTVSSGYSGGGGFSSGYSGGGGVGCEPYSIASGVGLLSDSSFARTRPVPEPSSIFGVIVFSILSGLGIISYRQRQP